MAEGAMPPHATSRRRAHHARTIAVAILGLAVGSCARAPTARVDVPIWTVASEGGRAFTIETPARFGRRIGPVRTYELRASVAIPPVLRRESCRLWIPSFLGNPTVYVDGLRTERQGLILPS